ncbi:MAG: fused response regulator/phosphatase [Magnetospirillum sp.]|nr:MAG: fused response regulator/phosphatase [Magnetospirillum sp.]
MTLDDVTVLIVDDNPLNRALLTAIVTSIGVTRIETATNGREGLAAIEHHKPDLVLLDVMMPEMDGYEMCRRLRAIHGRDELPVLFVTALDSPSERAACFAAGGTDMVTKPVNTEEITARVSVHLENRILLAGLKTYQHRLGEELAMAHATQETLHPDQRQTAEILARTGVDVSGVIETSSELGGDFWTVFETHRQTVGLLVADFTGHGVAAAFNTVRLHALMSRRPASLTGPAELLDFLNHELKRLLQPGQFAAAFACELDPRTGSLVYAGALAPPPILLEYGIARYCPVSGPPLGAFMDASFDEASLILSPGATLLAYSDALVESMVADEPVVDEATLLSWVAEAGDQGDLLDGLLARFHDRLPGQPPDDLTLVTLRRG